MVYSSHRCFLTGDWWGRCGFPWAGSWRCAVWERRFGREYWYCWAVQTFCCSTAVMWMKDLSVWWGGYGRRCDMQRPKMSLACCLCVDKKARNLQSGKWRWCWLHIWFFPHIFRFFWGLESRCNPGYIFRLFLDLVVLLRCWFWGLSRFKWQCYIFFFFVSFVRGFLFVFFKELLYSSGVRCVGVFCMRSCGFIWLNWFNTGKITRCGHVLNFLFAGWFQRGYVDNKYQYNITNLW